jgi:hypothetical protein
MGIQCCPNMSLGRRMRRRGEGIIALSMQATDDGKMAIIQVVAVDRHAFDAIFADKRAEIKVFEIGVDSREKIEDFLKAHKAGFTLDSLRVGAQ